MCSFGTVFEIRAVDVSGGKSSDGKGEDSTSVVPAHGPGGLGHAISRSTRSFARYNREDSEVSMGEFESRKFIAEHCMRNNTDARYALKKLSPEVVKDPALNLQGMIDVAVEAVCSSTRSKPTSLIVAKLFSSFLTIAAFSLLIQRFLAYLEHPNIIKVCSKPCQSISLVCQMMSLTTHNLQILNSFLYQDACHC